MVNGTVLVQGGQLIDTDLLELVPTTSFAGD